MRNRRDLKRRRYISNYSRNTIPINLDEDKYRSRECCTFFIRSEMQGKPHENIACVFLTWTILPIGMDSEF